MSDEAAPNPSPDPAPPVEPAPVPTPEPAADPAAPVEPAKPAEGEPSPEPVAADAPEVAKARKILAAASKRAEKALARELAAKAIEGRAKEYDDLRGAVAKDPLALLRLGGFESIKDYLRAVTDTATNPDTTPAEIKRLEAIETRLRQEDEAAAAEVRAEKIQAAQTKMFEAIDGNAKYDRATGALGHQLIWQEVVAYFEQHQDCPDAAVWLIADQVEKYLTDEGVSPRKAAKLAKAATPAEGPPRALTNGMTRTGPPEAAGEDGLPMDGKARMAAILARFSKPSAPVS